LFATVEGTAQRKAEKHDQHDRTERYASKSGPDRPVRENHEDSENCTEQPEEDCLLAPQQSPSDLVLCEKSDRNCDRG